MASWHSSLRTSWTLGTLLVGGTVVLLSAFAEPRLARYKMPRAWVVRESLPRTASGKLLKYRLRAEMASG